MSGGHSAGWRACQLRVHGGWQCREAGGARRLKYHGQSLPKKNPLIQNGSRVL